ncbi:MAG: ABC transporter permease, partial [Anaerolineae bacterium]|nr:ABC transporter permease [Anaerolineae bacterium]
MFFGPRWKKVLQDLLSNKTRTILTMLSISVGVFAVGINAAIGGIVMPDVQADYNSVNAHVAIIYTGTFDDTLIASACQVKGVSEAEGRCHISAQLISDGGSRQTISLTGIPPVKDMKVDQLQLPAGVPADLGKKEIFIERSAATLAYRPGDAVNIELPDGKIKQLIFKGYVHDVSTFPYAFAGSVPAYVTPETIEWLGGTRLYTQLLITVKENRTDKNHVTDISNAVADKLKKGGIFVDHIFMYAPGKHFSTDIFVAIMAILNLLGWLTVFLSAFLVINTINSLMAQHIKQIGIMKSIGGNSGQISIMYLTLILSFGLFSFMLAAPLSGLAGYQACTFMSNFVNFDLRGFRFIPEAFLIQALIAFVVPTLAALLPVVNGVRLSVREAISNYGNSINFGSDKIDRFLKKVRFLSRPMIISLRNSIRRKGRLGLTLSTLTLGGAIFMAVFNLWSSFGLTIEQIEGYFLADVNFSL